MSDYTWEDEKAFRNLSWQWSRAYDMKDWDLLISISAPRVDLYYAQLNPVLRDMHVTRDEYAAHFSKTTELGDERLKTQHQLGNVIFELQDQERAVGNWQGFVTHLRTLSDGNTAEWSVGSYIEHLYQRIDGVWKFAGIRPSRPLVMYGDFKDVIGQFD